MSLRYINFRYHNMFLYYLHVFFIVQRHVVFHHYLDCIHGGLWSSNKHFTETTENQCFEVHRYLLLSLFQYSWRIVH